MKQEVTIIRSDIAKQRTNDIHSNVNYVLENVVKKEINEAIQKGLYSIELWNGNVDQPLLIQKLKDLGYIVKRYEQNNRIWGVISWDFL